MNYSRLFGSFIIAIAFSYNINIYAHTDPHDSLIFDGENSISIRDNSDENKCEIRLIKLKGKAKGTAYVKIRAMGCGEGNDSD